MVLMVVIIVDIDIDVKIDGQEHRDEKGGTTWI
jgi:hypothetical protein